MLKKLFLIAITGLCLVSCEGVGGGYYGEYPIYEPYPLYPRPYFYRAADNHYHYNDDYCIKQEYNATHHHHHNH